MNLSLIRNAYGLVLRQMKVLRFIYEQDGRAFSRDIGMEIIPEKPARVYPSLCSLAKKGFIRGIVRGCYELTPSGKRLVEEMGDDEINDKSFTKEVVNDRNAFNSKS